MQKRVVMRRILAREVTKAAIRPYTLSDDEFGSRDAWKIRYEFRLSPELVSYALFGI